MELWGSEINANKIIAVKDATYVVAKRKLKKIKAYRDSNPDPYNNRCGTITNWANNPLGAGHYFGS